MLDISSKITTLRTAAAKGILKVKPETIERIRQGNLPKGDPLAVAKVAAIQGAKNTSQIIPYCHPLPLDYVGVEFTVGSDTIEVTTEVKAIYKTGVEMEALTAAVVAMVTIYDMLKMVDDTMQITGVTLLSKKGGKSGFTESFEEPLKAAVLVTSDSIAAGKKDDLSGRLIVERLGKEGVEVVEYKVIPDDTDEIERLLIRYADDMGIDLVMTTGGTGLSQRDFSPEATRKVIEREIPGVSEALRSFGQVRTPYSMLSRGVAGVRGKAMIVNLPGSKKGVADSLDALFPGLLHAFKILRGGEHREDGRRKKG